MSLAYEFEVFGKIRSITMHHATETVCTVVTFDGLIVVRKLNSNELYSFSCDMNIKCAFELC